MSIEEVSKVMEIIKRYPSNISMNQLVISLDSERDQLLADKQELVGALEEYGSHVSSTPLCERAKHSQYECTCGLSEVLSKHK